jgi:hypothetical protein
LRQIANVLGLSEANARQLLVRARARLVSERRLPGSDPEQLLADEAPASHELAFAA